MNDTNTGARRSGRRLAVMLAATGLFCGAPLLTQAQTNHGSTTGISNANQNGLANSNVNGIGTAPVPEASTWAAMGALVGAAALVAHRRRKAS